MSKQIQTWDELVALPRFKLPGSSRWWKIEPCNDNGDMGLWVMKVKDEWVQVANIIKPEGEAPIIAWNNPYGLEFKCKIDFKSIIA